MGIIVREHYPVASLPEDLRAGLPDDGWVRISLEAETDELRGEDMSLEEIFALADRAPRRSDEEIDADLMALRDEWQERG